MRVPAGVRFGLVLADAGYGISAPFRAGLSGRGLRWAVGIPRILKVYPADVVVEPETQGPGALPSASAQSGSRVRQRAIRGVIRAMMSYQ